MIPTNILCNIPLKKQSSKSIVISLSRDGCIAGCELAKDSSSEGVSETGLSLGKLLSEIHNKNEVQSEDK